MRIFLIIIAIVVLAVIAAFAFWALKLVREGRRVQAGDGAALELYPGQDVAGIPASWARGHDPEARLHRRMRDALSALRAAPDFDATFIDTRVRLEMAAADLDRRLVASAPLRVEQKQQLLDQAGQAVGALESVTSTMLAGRAPEQPALESALKQLQA